MLTKNILKWAFKRTAPAMKQWKKYVNTSSTSTENLRKQKTRLKLTTKFKKLTHFQSLILMLASFTVSAELTVCYVDDGFSVCQTERRADDVVQLQQRSFFLTYKQILHTVRRTCILHVNLPSNQPKRVH